MAKADPTGSVICDAGPLIHLDELSCVNLLSGFKEVLVAEAVWEEVARHRPAVLRRRVVKLDLRRSLPDASPQLCSLAEALLLDSGEMASLRLMQGMPDAIFLTDDAAARLVGERLGHEVHGTIGVVVRALRQGQRTKRQVLNLLRAIPQRSTLYINRALLDSVIEQVKNV